MSFSAENVTFETPSEAASTNNIALYINGPGIIRLDSKQRRQCQPDQLSYEDDSAHSGLYFQNSPTLTFVQQSSLTGQIRHQHCEHGRPSTSPAGDPGLDGYYAYSCNTNTTIPTAIGINHFSGPSNNFGTMGRRRTSGYPGRGLRLWEHAVHHGQRYPGQRQLPEIIR